MSLAVQATQPLARDLENLRESAETLSSVLQAGLVFLPDVAHNADARVFLSLALGRVDGMLGALASARTLRLVHGA
jgi:hypothetical protein